MNRSLSVLAFSLVTMLVGAAMPRGVMCQPRADSPAVTFESQRTGRSENMLEILAEIGTKFSRDYRNPLANAARVAYYSGVVRNEPSYELYLFQEMVYAGMNDSAIAGLTNALTRPGLDSALRLKCERLLAFAYLRQGEIDNCVMNHTAQSCLFPIQKGGVHSIQRGSRGAIEVYQSILKECPDDVKSRWLLNIAYMTLGEYPSLVPVEWLYPENLFASEYPLPRFTDIAPDLGLDVSRLSGGASMEDFDLDGDIDILTSSWGVNDPVLYFRNNGDGSFTEASKEAGLTGELGGLNMFHADYNNDGYVDVLITRGAWMGNYGSQPSTLLRNNGNGTFTDATVAAGLLFFHPTEAAAWGDFDNDGDLDLFIGCETTAILHPSMLYRNNGDGTFTNIAHEIGLDVQGMIKACGWGDMDNDGLIDLYISQFGGPNQLMKNLGMKNGKWSFKDVAVQAGVQDPFFSFPTFFFDYDNDGWLDLYVSDFGGNPKGVINGLPAIMDVIGPYVNDYLGKPHTVAVTKLYHNNHDGTFTDVAQQMHLDKTLFGMSANYGDLDNDGWLDFYVGTGHPDIEALVPNRMFRNAEGKVFQDVTSAGGFGHLQKGHAIAFADIDNDGDQDIFEEMGGAFEGDVARNTLYQNPGNANHWVTLMLRGVKANRFGVGARVKVTVQRSGGGTRDIHILAGSGGSFGSSSLQQEIGLGDAERIVSVAITWPGSGTKQTVANVPMDRFVAITEGVKEPAVVERKPIGMPAAGMPSMHHHDHGHEHH